MNPLLTIVIPTRNRSECALYCVIAALDATKNAEIVIADSGDDDQLEMALLKTGLNLERVIHIRTGRELNVVENFEAALNYCKGEYIIYIGDDDLVGPNIEKICQWASDNKIEAVVPYGNRFGVAYYWPGVKSKYFGDAYDSKLFIWSASSKIKFVNTKNELISAQRNIGCGLLLLPRLYHGLVRHDVLNRIRKKYGQVFGGVSPDIYSAVLIASETEKVFFVDYPFCVPGASPKSEAGSGAARTDRVAFEDSTYLKRFKGLSWDPEIPRFFSPYNVWGFSLNAAMRKLGRPLGLSPLCRLYARCLFYCWPYRHEIFECLRFVRKKYGFLNVITLLIFGLTSELFSLLFRIFLKALNPRAGGWARRYPDIKNSAEAFQVLANKIPMPSLPKLP